MDSCDASNKEAHNDSANRSRVLILGSGFGGIYAALELEKLLRRRDDVTVTLVTRDKAQVAAYENGSVAINDDRSVAACTLLYTSVDRGQCGQSAGGKPCSAQSRRPPAGQ